MTPIGTPAVGRLDPCAQARAACGPAGDFCFPWLHLLDEFGVLVLNTGAHTVRNVARFVVGARLLVVHLGVMVSFVNRKYYRRYLGCTCGLRLSVLFFLHTTVLVTFLLLLLLFTLAIQPHFAM